MKHRAFRKRATAVRWANAYSFVAFCFAIVGLVLPFAATRTPGQGSSDSKAAKQEDGDWTYVDHDFNGTRHSPLTQITPKNVKQLAKVCSYTFPETVPSETAPIVSAGVLYATSDHYTVALDAATCRVLWSYEWKPRDRDSTRAHRGASLADGKIIRGTEDNFLIALDAESGHLLWARQIAKPQDGFAITMPPLVTGGLIYIGPSGSERAGNGWIGAFRLSDGEPVWKFNIIPADGEPGADSWGPDPDARKHGGGALWTPLSYDTEKGLLYVSGGNPAPDFYDDGRPGANLYTNSIIALDGKTGRLAWYRQFIPHDVHDYDITHVNPVFTVTSKGKSLTAIATTGKDGVLRVVDRDSHEILYSVPFTTRTNTDAPASFTPIRVCPGTQGGDEWNSGAYSPTLNLLVVPSTDLWCSEIMKDKDPPSAEKAHAGEKGFFGGPIEHEPFSEARGRLTGFDSASGKERWRYESPTPLIAGVALTASNLVFTGEVGGYFDALDAQSGKMLFRYNLGDSIQGGVITYAAHGVQYVAVVSGNGAVVNKKVMGDISAGAPSLTVFAIAQK